MNEHLQQANMCDQMKEAVLQQMMNLRRQFYIPSQYARSQFWFISLMIIYFSFFFNKIILPYNSEVWGIRCSNIFKKVILWE